MCPFVPVQLRGELLLFAQVGFPAFESELDGFDVGVAVVLIRATHGRSKGFGAVATRKRAPRQGSYASNSPASVNDCRYFLAEILRAEFVLLKRVNVGFAGPEDKLRPVAFAAAASGNHIRKARGDCTSSAPTAPFPG